MWMLVISIAMLGAIGLATYVAVRCWDRSILMEERNARRDVEDREEQVRLRNVMRQRAEERQFLLAREVNHRAKNLLAVVLGVVRMSRFDDHESFVSDIEARIAALGRAHDLLADSEWMGADLRALAEGEVAPFRSANGGCEVTIIGAPLSLAAGVVQPLSLVLHELGTNAVKHGALASGGKVQLEWLTDGGKLHITWSERSAVALNQNPRQPGFGTLLINATITEQLGGTIDRNYLATGLFYEIVLPLEILMQSDLLTGPGAALDKPADPVR